LSAKDPGKDAVAQVEQTRETLRRFLAGIEPETLELALKGDPELTREAIEKGFLIDMALVRATRIFAQYLLGLDPAERLAVLQSHIAAVDGSEIASMLNTYSDLLTRVHAESPDLVEGAFPAFEAVLEEADFGKVREATVAFFDYFTVYMTRMIEVMMQNPVVVANIAGTVPPVVNSLLKIVSALLENMGLPPEILASAMFNTLAALDAEELGRVITMASRTAIDMHAGNYILGGTEPRFRAVFTDFMKRVLDNVDDEATNGAIVALAEDLEVVAGVLVELVARDPERAQLLARTGTALHNVLARILANALAEANAWPDELLLKMGEEARELDANEVGRAIDSAITLALRMRETNPDLHRDILSDVLQGVNTERLELLMTSVHTDVKEALLNNAGVRKALEPEEMGRRVNDALVKFNRGAASKPGAIKDYVTKLLAEVETRELEQAARTVSHGMMDAMLSSAERMKAMLKLGLSNVLRFARLVARGFMG
jgi:hypothetical protein